MILSITANQSLRDLGYLLNKDPTKLHNTSLSYGNAYLFFADIGDKKSMATLLLDINPVALVRKNDAHNSAFLLEEYVNDRPYVASSFMSIAINRVLGSAISGKSKLKQELSETSIELEVTISALPSRGGKELLYKLFEPLGYNINIKGHVLDNKFPEWGNSAYFTLTLQRKCLLSEFLTHLYILIPVLDNKKHYWIDEEEIEKLLRFGEGWLASHPEKDLITRDVI
ncbi:MAG: hypothetical protein SFT91_06070 [Rickettsiaceae bacterium]|nr:hypothetical protein [Rickettsiaceae bacterium]